MTSTNIDQLKKLGATRIRVEDVGGRYVAGCEYDGIVFTTSGASREAAGHNLLHKVQTATDAKEFS